MQGVQSSYKTDRGVKGSYDLYFVCEQLAMHVMSVHACIPLTFVLQYLGGAAGNIRAKFEQMAKQDEVP